MGNAHINPNRDRGHGRIYRVVWDKAPEAKIKSLAGASDAQLVAAMDSDNLFWRQTAQRLLVDGSKKGATAALKAKVKAGGAGAIQALWSLHGLGALDTETHQLALLSKDPALRRNAITALGNDAAALQLFFDTAVVQDSDLIVRLAAFNKMVEFEDKKTVALAAQKLSTDPANAEDEWLSQSLRNTGYEAIAGGKPEELAKGDVERGKKIFMTHPIAACTRCHVVDGVGGPIGPALDTIATRKQEDYILQSLVDPGAVIAEGFQGKVSPMPPMGVLLKPQELADVMAYIMTLK